METTANEHRFSGDQHILGSLIRLLLDFLIEPEYCKVSLLR